MDGGKEPDKCWLKFNESEGGAVDCQQFRN